jgi:anaerobic dimethyl sulfoxide reductase subunit B (iron-sulfur subunit)
MTKQYGFYVNTSTCSGCKTCQVSCQEHNNLPVDILWRRVFEYGGGSWVPEGTIYEPNGIFRYYVSISCQHCAEPQCVKVCPTTAMHKDENGIVSVDQAKCIGCRYCEWACPYGAPHFNNEIGKMSKCNMCEDLVEQGKRPACVDACPTRSLDFGEIGDLRKKYGNINGIEPLPTGDLTNPSLVIHPHKNAQLSGKGNGHLQNMPEEL